MKGHGLQRQAAFGLVLKEFTRLTEMQSAIGRVQLRKLPEWTAARQRHAAILTEGFLNRCECIPLPEPQVIKHICEII